MSEPERRPDANLGGRLMRGATWMVAMRISVRFLGFLNVTVLARLLMPEDFGLIAMAMIVVGLLNTFYEIGTETAIIRLPDARPEHYNSAWTLGIIMGALVSTTLMLIAPLGAEYFSDPRVETVIRAIGVIPFISSFQNIGVVDFRKKLRFSEDFRFNVLAQVFGIAITITLAFVLRNYWALVAGSIAKSVFRLGLSYFLHDFRPRLSLVKVHEILSFSIWITVRNIGAFLAKRTDQFIVGTLFGARDMGGYFLSLEISTILTTEAVLPFERALMPGYAKLAHDKPRLERAFTNVMGFVTLVAIPLGFGLSVVAADFVVVVLGEKWQFISPLMQIIAISSAALAITTASGTFLMTTGRVHVWAILTWCQFAILAVLLWFVAYGGSLEKIAWARVFASVSFLLLQTFITSRYVSGGYWRLISPMIRPLVAGLIMVFAVQALHAESIQYPVVRLMMDAFAGALVYGLSVLVLWRLAGLPEGIESELISRLPQSVGSKLPRGWRR